MKHVANCHDCSMILKSLLSLSRTVDELVPKTEVDRRPLPESMLDGTKPARLMRSRRLAITAIATIAGVAIIAVSVTKLSKPYALRGKTRGFELIAPRAGAMIDAGHIRFEWKAVAKASGYFVEIFDSSLELVWRSELLHEPQVELPARTVTAVQKGDTYFWRVTAVQAEGPQIVSKSTKFSIRR